MRSAVPSSAAWCASEGSGGRVRERRESESYRGRRTEYILPRGERKGRRSVAQAARVKELSFPNCWRGHEGATRGLERGSAVLRLITAIAARARGGYARGLESSWRQRRRDSYCGVSWVRAGDGQSQGRRQVASSVLRERCSRARSLGTQAGADTLPRCRDARWYPTRQWGPRPRRSAW